MSRRLSSIVLTIAVVAGACALLASTAFSSDTSRTAGSNFVFTRIVFQPRAVKENGRRSTQKFYWRGDPTFPVTAWGHGRCPADVNCGARDAQGWGALGSHVFTRRADPLVLPSSLFCNGNHATYTIRTENWLVDANGHRTKPIYSSWVCQQ